MASVQDRLRIQIEFYFSPQNLSNDQFLKSQMNADRYVPISVIAGFPKVTAISDDVQALVTSLASSLFVELNADKTALRAKQYSRNLLVIRNLPTDFPIEDIKTAFVSKPELLSKIVSVKPDFSCFVITFTDASVCVEAFNFLSTQQLNNQLVSCYIQSAAPSFIPTRPAPVAPVTTQTRGLFFPDSINKSPQQHTQPRQNQQPQNGQRQSNPSQQRRQPNSNYPSISPQQQQRAHTSSSTKPITQYSNTTPTQSQQPIPSPTKIGYAGDFTHYDRKTIADLVENLGKQPSTIPSTFVGKDNQPVAPVIMIKPHTSTCLLHPVPVMFPASPSPEMAIKQPEVLPPFLALGQTQQQAAPASSTFVKSPQSLPSLPPRGGIVLSSSAGSSGSTPLTGLPSLTTSTVFKSLNLSASADESVASKDNKKVPIKKLTAHSSAFVPRSAHGTSPAQQTTSAQNNSSTTTSTAPKKTSLAGNKDGKDGKKTTSSSEKSTSTTAKSTSTKPSQPRIDPKKRAAMSMTAFPSLGGKKAVTTTTTITTTTTTTTPSAAPKLNFAATVAKEAKTEHVEAQKAQLAAFKRSQDDAVRAKAVAEAKTVEPDAKEGEEAKPEAKENKPKKAKKAKVEKAAPGDEAAVAAPAANTTEAKEKKAAQPKKTAQPKKEKKVEENTTATPSPAGSWAAKLAQPKPSTD